MVGRHQGRLFTPLEAKQGAAQKIFYIHVPAAWVAFLAFALVAIASGVFLWLRDKRLDRFAESSAEVGVIFTTVVLITGPLWAKPIWGTYWAWWDVRLVSTLFLWFIYIAYLVLRGAVESPSCARDIRPFWEFLERTLNPVSSMRSICSRPCTRCRSWARQQTLAAGEMLLTCSFRCFVHVALLAFVRSRYRYAVERDCRSGRGDVRCLTRRSITISNTFIALGMYAAYGVSLTQAQTR